jgi:hypothetical protein
MPAVASDQQYDESVMLVSLFKPAVHWPHRGLPVETIKIAVGYLYSRNGYAASLPTAIKDCKWFCNGGRRDG